MSREEAIVLTSRYLAQLPGHHALALDYTATIQSLTDYAECWYADLHYHFSPEQLLPSSNGGPGFTINKRDHLIRSISWLKLYELNCEPLLF